MPARVSILAMGAPGRKPCWPAPPEATGLRADASSRSPAHASSPGSAPRDRLAKSICAPGGGMPERRRALFVAPEAPYPLVGGGALRAASVLQFLAQSHTVDAIVFHTPGSPVLFPPGLIDRLDTVELPAHSKHYAARALRNGQRMLRRSPPLVDRFAGFGDTIGALLGSRPTYDVAVLEHFWCAPYH